MLLVLSLFAGVIPILSGSWITFLLPSLAVIANYSVVDGCLDNFSKIFVFFSVVVFMCCFAHNQKVNLSLLAASVLLCFILSGIVTFFVVFEFILIPIAAIIFWSKTGERFSALQFFVVYTLILSTVLFVYLVSLTSTGSLKSFEDLIITSSSNVLIWVVLLSIAVNFPVFGLHSWLPRAHVEASTVGSIILAACLLNLGSYGLLRLLAVIQSNQSLTVLTAVLLLLTVIAAAVCLFQSDVNSYIAISSVVHINILFALFVSITCYASLSNSLVSMSHAYISAIMFFMAGTLYEYSASRSLTINRAVALASGILAIWLVASFCNAGLPPFLNAWAEILSGASLTNIALNTMFVFGAVVFLSGVFSVLLFAALASETSPEQARANTAPAIILLVGSCLLFYCLLSILLF